MKKDKSEKKDNDKNDILVVKLTEVENLGRSVFFHTDNDVLYFRGKRETGSDYFSFRAKIGSRHPGGNAAQNTELSVSCFLGEFKATSPLSAVIQDVVKCFNSTFGRIYKINVKLDEVAYGK